MHGKSRPYIENKNMLLIKIFENAINFFQNLIFCKLKHALSKDINFNKQIILKKYTCCPECSGGLTGGAIDKICVCRVSLT